MRESEGDEARVATPAARASTDSPRPAAVCIYTCVRHLSTDIGLLQRNVTFLPLLFLLSFDLISRLKIRAFPEKCPGVVNYMSVRWRCDWLSDAVGWWLREWYFNLSSVRVGVHYMIDRVLVLCSRYVFCIDSLLLCYVNIWCRHCRKEEYAKLCILYVS